MTALGKIHHHLAVWCTGFEDVLHVEARHLVDILAGDHESERDRWSRQGLGNEVRRERNHSHHGRNARVAIAMHRHVGKPPVDDAARRPDLQRIESVALKRDQEPDARGKVLLDVSIAMSPEACVRPFPPSQ